MPPKTFLIVGLGNPGSEYEGTRHNVGFDVVDAISAQTKIPVDDFGSNALSGFGSWRSRSIGLAKPTTFVNLSGSAVKSLLNKKRIPASQLLVVVDDLNLPVGKIRIRAKGGDGGHNGLTDIINRLGRSDFARLRVGIGSDFSRGRQADYVLSPFVGDEKTLIDEAIVKARDAALHFVRFGLSDAMNRHNRG